MHRLIITVIAAALLLVCSGVSAELRILSRPSKSEEYPNCKDIFYGVKEKGPCLEHKHPKDCERWVFHLGYFNAWMTHGDTEGLRLPRNATPDELAIAFLQWWSQLPNNTKFDYNDGPTSACLRDAMMWKYN